MNATRRIIDAGRWLDASSAFDDVPNVTLWVSTDDGHERLGEARLRLQTLDETERRIALFAALEVRIDGARKQVAVMVEIENPGEAARQALRENDTAVRMLDAVALEFEGGVRVALDHEAGFWRVTSPECSGAVGSREDMIAIAHAMAARGRA